MKLPLTPKQKRAMDCIVEYYEDKGVTPTRAALSKMLEYKTDTSAQYMVDRLIARGWIDKEAGQHSSIRIL